MGKAKGNGDEVPKATRDKLGKILDRAAQEEAERQAYDLLAIEGTTESGEGKAIRKAYDKKMGYGKGKGRK